VRNEASNIDGVIRDLVSQSQLAQCEVLVLNDHSTDDTAMKLARYSVRTLEGKQLPSGWLGKNFACHQLSEVATAHSHRCLFGHRRDGQA
jgi:chlorobactene glucosyltransferase